MRAFIIHTFIKLSFFIATITIAYGQHTPTRQDTLRGSVTKEREWWDVLKYEIDVRPDFPSKTIRGFTIIRFKVLKSSDIMQLDLQQPMTISSVEWQGQQLVPTRDGNVYYLQFTRALEAGSEQSIRINYSGKPTEAVRAPWDGGWIWTKDMKGRPWMSVACQGLGASVWYPCKDHQGDEPDQGALVSITVPDSLVAVANGKLVESKSVEEGLKKYTWSLVNPVNSYNIIPYIGKYVNWQETFSGEKGKLDCSYWVLDYELEKAKKQFQQVPKMLSCFEHWFGPFPFYEDGYKLVQAPYLGMEHQSAIAYGNEFKNGYLGRDLSETGWGLKWDYIIVHESGHEWFANNITTYDMADMWVHEGFTSYSETIYTTCEFGVEAGNSYVIGLRKIIGNDAPIIGPYGINQPGSHDMYFKGANIIHTIRQVINDDEKFRTVLRGLNETFWHKIVTTQMVEEYITKKSGIDFTKVFDQYLRTVQLPVLEYKFSNNKLYYRWANCIDGFNMPVKIEYHGQQWLKPTKEWQQMRGNSDTLKVDPNFYVDLKKVSQ